MAFLKRNQSDSVVQRLPKSTEAVPPQAPAVVFQKEGRVRIPTPHAILLNPVNKSTGTAVLEQKSCPQRCVLGALQKFPQSPKVWNRSRIQRQFCACGERFHRAPNLAVRCSGVDFEQFKNAHGCQLEKCGVPRAVEPIRAERPSNVSECESARALEPIHSESSSHGPDGCELGHT